MKKRLILSAMAAALNSTPFIQPALRFTGNKYTPHQGQQERARRLRQYSAAWYGAQNSLRCNHV